MASKWILIKFFCENLGWAATVCAYKHSKILNGIERKKL